MINWLRRVITGRLTAIAGVSALKGAQGISLMRIQTWAVNATPLHHLSELIDCEVIKRPINWYK